MATRKSVEKSVTQLAWRFEPPVKPLHYKESDAKYVGDEPTYPTLDEQEEWSHSEYTQTIVRTLSWYHRTQDNKAAIAWASQFIGRNPKRSALANLIKNGDVYVGPTVGFAFRAGRAGLKLRFSTLRSLMRTIKAAQKPKDPGLLAPVVDENKKKEKEQVKTTQNIQERLAEKTSEFIGEVEGRFDEFVANGFKGDPKLVDMLVGSNIVVQHLKTVQQVISNHITEFEELSDTKDPQLLEGYKKWGKRQIKAAIAWWTQALADTNSYNVIKKAAKAPRKKKAVSPEKMVSKMKYLKEFKELNLTSVPPTSILTASELWIYNTKTRKLGLYVVDQYAGTLGVKGTAILGYDEAASVQKTLRKPPDQLKEWAKNGKPAAKKWFKGIKSVETKLNGRINGDMILLKAYK